MPEISTHPSAQALALFVQGKLLEAQAVTVAAHLETCADCRQAAAALPPGSFEGKVRAARPGNSSMPAPKPGAGASVMGKAAAAAAPAGVPPQLANHPKFRIVRQLGSGGMGVIWLAEHRVMEKLVALKVISRAVLDNPQALARFHAEARAAGKLDHPNVARAYDADQAGDLHFLVMEFVEGTDLAKVLEKRGPLPVADACRYVRQAAVGLQHAHEKGMVHRDIKPQNLMLTPQGVVKVLDFGLARLRSERKAAPRVTQMDSFMGTPEYVAPEQASDAREADIRADIYSLGCTLYALLAGRPPFVGESVVNVVMAHIQQEPQLLHELRPDVPPGLSVVVAKMLAKDPAQRYQRPIEVAQALVPFIKAGGKPGAASGVSVPPVASAGTGTRVGGDTSRVKGLGAASVSKPIARPAAAQEQGSPFEGLADAPSVAPASKKRTKRPEKAKPTPATGASRLTGGGRLPLLAGAACALAVLLAGIVIWIKWTDAKGNSTEVHVEVGPDKNPGPAPKPIPPAPPIQNPDPEAGGNKKPAPPEPDEEGFVQPSTPPVPSPSPLSDVEQKEVTAAIERGVAYLKQHAPAGPLGNHRMSGLHPLVGLTLLECGVPTDEPVLASLIKRIREGAPGLSETYSLSLATLFLDRLGDKQDEPLIRRLAARLIAGQNEAGGWTYSCPALSESDALALLTYLDTRPPRKPTGPPLLSDKLPKAVKDLPVVTHDPADKFPQSVADDNSNTQFAVLGVCAARRHGVPIGRTVALISARFRRSQNDDGSWGYTVNLLRVRRDSMTCAGLLGLAVARAEGGAESPDKDPAISRGLEFLGKKVQKPGGVKKPERGGANDLHIGADSLGDLYWLWAVERIGILYNLATIGGNDWYAWGAGLIVAAQRDDGSWVAGQGQVVDTCFALLFLKRADLTPDLTRALRGLTQPEAPPADRPAEKEGFVPLFNGKDLTGWNTHPKQSGDWHVEKGLLVNAGSDGGGLYTERNNYKDFRLRLELRVIDEPNGGVHFRAPNDGTGAGYRAFIYCNDLPKDGRKTGGLGPGRTHPVLVPVDKPAVRAGDWFTMEIIAKGNHLVIQVNEKTTADYVDREQLYTSGHILLGKSEKGMIEFRKIEIKEFPAK